MKNQLGVFLSFLVVFSALGVAAGWYAGWRSGSELVREAVVHFDETIKAQNDHIADLEGTTLLIAQDAAALRESLVTQQLLAQEETSALRTALDEKVGELSSAVGSHGDTLASLADVADLSGLIDAWSPFVYDLTCKFESDSRGAVTGSGSATLMHDAGGIRFVTNAHIVEDSGGARLVRCSLERKDADTLTVDEADIEISEGDDVAYGRVSGSPLAMAAADVCPTVPRIGERVIILGYPTIGAKESVTVTEGIISGFDEDYYTTSAKIEKGNSGGAAVSAERDCFLGIPTLVVAGRIESLARILPALSL